MTSTTDIVILAVQTAAACFACGFIWTMQVLDYPLIALIGPDEVPAYEAAHNRRFGILIGPPILAVLGSGVAMLFGRSTSTGLWTPVVILILSVGIVLHTVRYGAPAHSSLEKRFDTQVHRQLVRTNWVRTLAWTAIAGVDFVAVCRLAVG